MALRAMGFDSEIILVQLLGFAATGFALALPQVNRRPLMLAINIVASLLWCAHFALLGAFGGAAMNLITMIRSSVYALRCRHWLIPAGFSALVVLATVVTWQGWPSLLPLSAGLIAAIGFWMPSPAHIRLAVLVMAPHWFIYNLIYQSWAGIAVSVFQLCSALIGMYRFDFRRRRPAGGVVLADLQRAGDGNRTRTISLEG